MNLATEQFASSALHSIESLVFRMPLSASRMMVLLLSAGCTLLLATAHAQTYSQTQSTRTEAEATTLEEIIITARKREESVQNIPETIVAISSEVLENAHFSRMDDLGALVSNLNIATQSDNTPGVVLRGIGAYGVVQGVGFYANDVQLFEGQTVRPDDLERVEVLKGPQGTLYGGSNIGGAIKYITKLPTDTFEAAATVEVGGYGTQTYSAIVSGPLIANSPNLLDGRISVYDTRTDGYIYDPTLSRTVDGGRETGGRATLLYRPSDSTTVTLYLNGDWNYSADGANVLYKAVADDIYSLQVLDGTEPKYERGLYSATLKVEQEFAGDLALTSLSTFFDSYGDSTTDTDKGPAPILTGYNHFATNVYAQELRLASAASGPFKWLIGLYGQVYNDEIFVTSRQFTGDPGDPTTWNDPALFVFQPTQPVQRHNEYAIFGNASYDLDSWTFEAGLRGDYYNSSMADALYDLVGQQHGNELLPKFSASYHFDKDLMAYATIARGFEPGDEEEIFDANGNPEISQYKPETTWSYEAGIKSTLLEHRLRLNAAVFYTKYNNRLFQTNIIQSGQLVGITSNIGNSTNYGVEFDFSAQLAEGLLLSGTYGLTKAVWGNTPPYLDPDLSAAVGSNVFVNLRGGTAPDVPSYTASLALDWSHNLTGNLVFGFRGDASFTGYSFWDVTDHYRQNPYQLLNLGARLEEKHWTVSAHVSNVTNTLYNVGFSSGPELGAPFNVGDAARPRLWSLSGTYRW
jgi:iron complex outermembrane recepter protein